MIAVMYSGKDCPYCVQALGLLKDNGVEVTEIKVGSDIGTQEFKDAIFGLANIVPTTVPQIVLDGEYVGGCDDLIAYYERKLSAGDFSDIDI